MKRIVKIGILTLCFLVALIVGLYLFKNEYTTYAIVLGVVSLVLLFSLISYIINTRSEEAIYSSTLRKVLNNYDAILVESHNFPDLKGKNIIKVTNMDDLVDAQIEIRKPIYYMIEGEDSCSFVLLDNSEACIYILKQNESVQSPLELIINEYEKNNDIDSSLLEDIERTTIIKLNNMKSFKVSPYKKKGATSSEDKNVTNSKEENDDDKIVEKKNENNIQDKKDVIKKEVVESKKEDANVEKEVVKGKEKETVKNSEKSTEKKIDKTENKDEIELL